MLLLVLRPDLFATLLAEAQLCCRAVSQVCGFCFEQVLQLLMLWSRSVGELPGVWDFLLRLDNDNRCLLVKESRSSPCERIGDLARPEARSL